MCMYKLFIVKKYICNLGERLYGETHKTKDFSSGKNKTWRLAYHMRKNKHIKNA